MNTTTTAQTIEALTREHLNRGGLLFGQCVTAVGWIGGTVPSDCINTGIIEIPMTDVAGPGFAVGAALMGKRPIFVVRYQGFMWLNASTIVNYAAKSKEIWGIPCPVFIRAIGAEGQGVGHTASGGLHSLFMHTPGIRVEAPMLPSEYRAVWQRFLKGDDPVYCSEHRSSFSLTDLSLCKYKSANPRITIIAIGAARINAEEATKTDLARLCDLFPIVTLKPFFSPMDLLKSLHDTKLGLVIDCGYEIAGAARSIAYDLAQATSAKMYALGLEDRSSGASKQSENITPSAEKIRQTINDILKGHIHATST